MKRSEMVNKLIYFVYSATDGKVTINQEDSDLLLKFIEKAGMLPPLNEQNYHFMDRQDNEIVNLATKFYFTWETENEN